MVSPYKIPGIEGLEAEAAQFHEILSLEKNDLACVLLSLAFLDLCLASLLTKVLIDGETSKQMMRYTGLLGPFHARAQMAYCLGLIPKPLFQNLQILGEMRNNFAHSHLSLSFEDTDVIEHCERLIVPKANGTEFNSDTGETRKTDKWPAGLISTPRRRFVLIVSLIADSLMGLVSSTEKRGAKDDWLPPDLWLTVEVSSSEW